MTWLERRLTSKLRALTSGSARSSPQQSSSASAVLLTLNRPVWVRPLQPEDHGLRFTGAHLHPSPSTRCSELCQREPEGTDQWGQKDHITQKRQRRNPQPPESEILSARNSGEPFPELLKTCGLPWPLQLPARVKSCSWVPPPGRKLHFSSSVYLI